MSEEERERVVRQGDDPDVVAHKVMKESDDSGSESAAERVAKEDETPDVEAHKVVK